MEPFFIKLALFDVQKGVKISEDFHVDLNEVNIRSLLPKRKKLVRVGLDYEEIDYDEDDDSDDTKPMESLVNHIKEVWLVVHVINNVLSYLPPPFLSFPLPPSLPLYIKAIFSVLFPNPEIYLVARIEKVLHGTIQSCAEPYQKTGDLTKVINSYLVCCRDLTKLLSALLVVCGICTRYSVKALY